MHRRIRPLAFVLLSTSLTACASRPDAATQSSIDRAVDAERLSTTGWRPCPVPITIRSLAVESSPMGPSGLRSVRCRVELMADGEDPVTLQETPLRILLAAVRVQSPAGPIDLFELNENNPHLHFVAGNQPGFVVTPKQPTELSVVLPFHHLASDLPPGPLALAPFPDQPARFAGFTNVTAAGPVRLGEPPSNADLVENSPAFAPAPGPK